MLSDLGSLRVRGEDRARALRGSVNVELTTEGENRRQSTLVFVGPGRGSYDASGNFVAGGDYDLRVSLSPDLERLARAATSAHLEWGGPAARGGRPRRTRSTPIPARPATPRMTRVKKRSATRIEENPGTTAASQL